MTFHKNGIWLIISLRGHFKNFEEHLPSINADKAISCDKFLKKKLFQRRRREKVGQEKSTWRTKLCALITMIAV